MLTSPLYMYLIKYCGFSTAAGAPGFVAAAAGGGWQLAAGWRRLAAGWRRLAAGGGWLAAAADICTLLRKVERLNTCNVQNGLQNLAANQFQKECNTCSRCT